MREILVRIVLISQFTLFRLFPSYSQTEKFTRSYFENEIKSDFDSIRNLIIPYLNNKDQKKIKHIKLILTESDAIRVQGSKEIIFGYLALINFVNLMISNEIGNRNNIYDLDCFPGFYTFLQTFLGINEPPELFLRFDSMKKKQLLDIIYEGKIKNILRSYLTYIFYHEIGHILNDHINNNYYKIKSLKRKNKIILNSELDADDFAVFHFCKALSKNIELTKKDVSISFLTSYNVLNYFFLFKEGRLTTVNEILTRQILMCGRAQLMLNCKEDSTYTLCNTINKELLTIFNKLQVYEYLNNPKKLDSLEQIVFNENNLGIVEDLFLSYSVETDNGPRNLDKTIFWLRFVSDKAVKTDEKYGYKDFNNALKWIERARVMLAAYYYFELDDLPRSKHYLDKAKEISYLYNENFYNLLSQRMSQ